MRRPIRATLRLRLTAAAVVVLAAAAGLGAVGLLHLVHDSLRGSVEDATRLEAAGVVQLVKSGLNGPDLPAPRSDGVAQLVDAAGRVVASSVKGAQRPVAALHPGPVGASAVEVGSLPVRDEDAATGDGDRDAGPALVVASAVPGTDLTVYVASPLWFVEHSTMIIGLSLAAGLPVFVGFAGLLVWVLTGRALRPVEDIRAAVTDITARDLHRRVAEPATGDEIDRLARTMNDMLDRLERSSQRQRQFVADASHELRSPVTSIRALLEAALAAEVSTDWPTTVGEVLDETGRMQRIVEDLLLLARVDEGTLVLRRGPVDVDDIVLDEARRLRHRGSVLVDVSAVSAGRVDGDAHQLARVVRNLADNAERHAAGTVRFSLRTEGDVVVLVVSDDGPGIPAERRREVFERFARLEADRARGQGGTGLGLAIVKELVTAHGGSVRVADAGPGAHLVVELPAARAAEAVGPVAVR